MNKNFTGYEFKTCDHKVNFSLSFITNVSRIIQKDVIISMIIIFVHIVDKISCFFQDKLILKKSTSRWTINNLTFYQSNKIAKK